MTGTWSHARGTGLLVGVLLLGAGSLPAQRSFYEMDFYRDLYRTGTPTTPAAPGSTGDGSVPSWAQPGTGVTGSTRVGDVMGMGDPSGIPGPDLGTLDPQGVPYPVSQPPTQGTALPVHTVVRGDTLWAIAARYCGNGNSWRNIYEANREQIRNPNLIYPDQRFRIACSPGEAYSPGGGKPWYQTNEGRQVVDQAGGRGSAFITHMPLPRGSFRISSGFGPRRSQRLPNGKHSSHDHEGLDMAAPSGTPVGAVGPGRVLRSGWVDGYGMFVELQHPDGHITRYGHMQRGSLLVRDGDTVYAGQQIGRVGSTGNSSGPHLHFEVRTPQLVALRPNSFLGLA